MKVRDIMTGNVKTCGPYSLLASAIEMMWNEDIGCVPVVDTRGHPVGVVTDRDIAISSWLNHRDLWELTVHEVLQDQVLQTCREDDDVYSALEIMKGHGIRRLPVVDEEGRLTGILSFGDLVASAEVGTPRRKPPLSFNDLVPMLKVCCKHRRKVLPSALSGK